MKAIDKYDYYVALITVTATEEAGLRYMYNDWKPLFLKGDEQIYFETSFERNGKIHKIITAGQSAWEVNICWWTMQMRLCGKFLRQQALPMWLLFDEFGIHCKSRYTGARSFI